MELNRGQALVETSLVLPMFLMVILAVLDPFFFSLNMAAGKAWTFLAAREASIHQAGGGVTCAMRVAGTPIDSMTRAENVTLSVTPCPNDPYWIVPTGSQVLARIDFDYQTIFWPAPSWHGTLETRNIFQ